MRRTVRRVSLPSLYRGMRRAPPCLEVTFSPAEPTQEFNFGTGHKIKITANVVPALHAGDPVRFHRPGRTGRPAEHRAGSRQLHPVRRGDFQRSRWAAAASTTSSNRCRLKGDPGCTDCDYSGDVLYKVFWDFPTLDQLHNVRLYRAPIPEEDDQTCPDGFNCYTQDITGTVFAVGDSNTGDPGVGGKSKGFSDYEVVDLTSPDLAGGQNLDRAEEGQRCRHPVRPEGRGEEERRRGQLRRASRRARGRQGFQQREPAHHPAVVPGGRVPAGRQRQRQAVRAQLLPR